MPTQGCDEAWSRASVADLQAAGIRFVIGYFSSDPSKNLTAERVAELHAAGIGVGAVFEDGTSNWQGGEAQGMADGREAMAQATTLGWPPDAAIYFALDTDIPGGSPAALAYLQAAASQIAPHPAGVYACGDILLQAVGHVVATGWLSGSTGWSGYQAALDSPQLVVGILQNGSATVGGASVDTDRLLVPDDEVGLWWPDGPLPTPPSPPSTFSKEIEMTQLPPGSKPLVVPTAGNPTIHLTTDAAGDPTASAGCKVRVAIGATGVGWWPLTPSAVNFETAVENGSDWAFQPLSVAGVSPQSLVVSILNVDPAATLTVTVE